MPCPKTPAISISGRPSAVQLKPSAVQLKPSAFHLGPPLLAASQPQALDLRNAVSPCISSATISSASTLSSSEALRHPVRSLLGRPFSTPSEAYRRPSSDSPPSSPSAAIFSPIHFPTLSACCPVATRAPLADRLRLRFALRSISTFCSDLGSSDLDSVCRMSRQNPRRPTVPAGDNPSKRTRGFNFKLTPQVSSSRVAASSLVPSEPMASFSSTPAGPSHPQVGAGSPSAVAVQPRPAANSADFDDRQLGLVSDAPAASGLHAFGALPRTPLETLASREAPGGGYQLSEPGGYSPAQQVRAYSPRPRAHHSFDTTHDQSHRSPDRVLAPESEFTQGPDFARAPRPAVSEPPGPSG